MCCESHLWNKEKKFRINEVHDLSWTLVVVALGPGRVFTFNWLPHKAESCRDP